MRSTIDYGIDLGTTNSVIARMGDRAPEVINNDEGFKCTPSVVWIDKRSEIRVGHAARQKQVDDPDNVAFEFKRNMGDAEAFTFARSGRQMAPPELSAEVLKSLKISAEKRDSANILAAAITVPAAFELPNTKATNEAAALAGFLQAPQLQEPVAAALAYGVEADSDKVYWLVFDLGGGTFDAALINLRDGMFRVVNHTGDNRLGGKDIDDAIVETLLVPDIQKRLSLSEFRSDNRAFRSAIAKLKRAAEEAKIRLSVEETVDIEIPILHVGSAGETIEYDYELRRSDVENLAEPVIRRAIRMCRDALAEKKIDPANVEKVLLVGGPTQMPYLRERLLDTREGLGIRLDFTLDPLTVVAEGAAIFASRQKLDIPKEAFGLAHAVSLDLDYQPSGPDTDFEVAGRVSAETDTDYTGWTVQFVNEVAEPAWRSGRVSLSGDGTFLVELVAEEDVLNCFQIDLRDSAGNNRPTHPAQLTRRVDVRSAEFENAPLTHSLGVARADNTVRWLARKGEALPIKRRREIFHTVRSLNPGQSGDLTKIPFVEGDNQRASRNPVVGELQISAARISRILPTGSEIEISFSVDESRLLKTTAFVPILEEEFDDVITIEREATASADQLRADFDAERKRKTDLQSQIDETADEASQALLDRVEKSDLIDEVDRTLERAAESEDARKRSHQRLMELQAALDRVEEQLEWPKAVEHARSLLSSASEVLESDDYDPSASERKEIAGWQARVRKVMDDPTKDVETLRQAASSLFGAYWPVQRRAPKTIVGMFYFAEERQDRLEDSSLADRLLREGHRALAIYDVETLRRVVSQLWRLLPFEDQQSMTGHGSGVM